MWMLHATTGELKWFAKKPESGYLILSHVWSAEEQTFQDIKALESSGGLSNASAKIRDCCAFARRRGYEWVWIDTCCIDKTSSAELSEAINSMFVWYRESDECVAFLQDVDETEDPRAADSQFRCSRWFTRGWTLQELIAPQNLVFVSKNWRVMGTKATLASVVEEITRIGQEILMFRKSHTRVSVARRMSWAAKRQTTREEDRAYSLLGIFNVNIPTVYGEGDHAFIRLQEEILKHIPDQSIFAWGPPMLHNLSALARSQGSPGKLRLRALLAVSPDLFAYSSEIRPISPEALSTRLGVKVPPSHFTLTSYGMHARLPLMKAPGCPSDLPIWLAVLACTDGGGHLVALILQPQLAGSQDRFFVGASVYVAQQLSTGGLHCDSYRFAALAHPPRKTWLSRSVAKVTAVHIPHRLDTFNFQLPQRFEGQLVEGTSSRQQTWDIIAAPCEVVVPAWFLDRLAREDGVRMVLPDPVDASLRFEHRRYDKQEIRLMQESSSDIIVIEMWACPYDAFQYIHATAALHRSTGSIETVNDPDPTTEQLERCTSEHITRWQDYSKSFSFSTLTVRLSFEVLNEQFRGLMMTEDFGMGLGIGLHSLDIHVGATKSGEAESTGADVQAVDTLTTPVPPSRPRDKEDRHSGDGGWKYWDGHSGERPFEYTDAMSSTERPSPRFRAFSRIYHPISVQP